MGVVRRDTWGQYYSSEDEGDANDEYGGDPAYSSRSDGEEEFVESWASSSSASGSVSRLGGDGVDAGSGWVEEVATAGPATMRGVVYCMRNDGGATRHQSVRVSSGSMGGLTLPRILASAAKGLQLQGPATRCFTVDGVEVFSAQELRSQMRVVVSVSGRPFVERTVRCVKTPDTSREGMAKERERVRLERETGMSADYDRPWRVNMNPAAVSGSGRSSEQRDRMRRHSALHRTKAQVGEVLNAHPGLAHEYHPKHRHLRDAVSQHVQKPVVEVDLRAAVVHGSPKKQVIASSSSTPRMEKEDKFGYHWIKPHTQHLAFRGISRGGTPVTAEQHREWERSTRRGSASSGAATTRPRTAATTAGGKVSPGEQATRRGRVASATAGSPRRIGGQVQRLQGREERSPGQGGQRRQPLRLQRNLEEEQLAAAASTVRPKRAKNSASRATAGAVGQKLEEDLRLSDSEGEAQELEQAREPGAEPEAEPGAEPEAEPEAEPGWGDDGNQRTSPKKVERRRVTRGQSSADRRSRAAREQEELRRQVIPKRLQVLLSTGEDATMWMGPDLAGLPRHLTLRILGMVEEEGGGVAGGALQVNEFFAQALTLSSLRRHAAVVAEEKSNAQSNPVWGHDPGVKLAMHTLGKLPRKDLISFKSVVEDLSQEAPRPDSHHNRRRNVVRETLENVFALVHAFVMGDANALALAGYGAAELDSWEFMRRMVRVGPVFIDDVLCSEDLCGLHFEDVKALEDTVFDDGMGPINIMRGSGYLHMATALMVWVRAVYKFLEERDGGVPKVEAERKVGKTDAERRHRINFFALQQACALRKLSVLDLEELEAGRLENLVKHPSSALARDLTGDAPKVWGRPR